MIIDADVHISPLAQNGSIYQDELIRRMDKAGVDKALTWLQPPICGKCCPTIMRPAWRSWNLVHLQYLSVETALQIKAWMSFFDRY